MRSLLKKELKTYLASPLAAVLSALFLFLTGFVFTAHLTQVSPYNLPEASLRGMMYFMAIVLLFLSPLITMKSFAEERKTGTMELLKTSPISDLQMVMGKFLSAWILCLILLALTVEFPIFLLLTGEPDIGPLLLSYLGLLLMGGGFLAAGLFCSALTKNQMSAALLAFVLLLVLWFLAEVGGPVGEKISVIGHLESFGVGVLDTTDVVYYLLFIFIFLFLTVRTLEAERWR